MKKVPTLVIIEPPAVISKKSNLKYFFDGINEKTGVSEIDAFVSDFLKGRLLPTLKS